jgi:ferredoxin
MKVVADLEACIGAGTCVHTAPKVFDQSSEDGTVRLLVDVVPDEDVELVREAVDLCPSAALSISEEDWDP